MREPCLFAGSARYNKRLKATTQSNCYLKQSPLAQDSVGGVQLMSASSYADKLAVRKLVRLI